MLKRYAHLYKTLFRLTDIFIISGCWVAVYFLFFPELFYSEGARRISEHIRFLIPVVAAYSLVFTFFKLYEPKRTENIMSELLDIFKASLVSIGLFSLGLSSINEHRYSGASLLVFWILTIVSIFLFRIVLRGGLHRLRSKGYNLRHILIVGAGKLAQEVARTISGRHEFGLKIIGFLSNEPNEIGTRKDGVDIIGTYRDIKSTVTNRSVDQIIFAVPQNEYRLLAALLGTIHDKMASIRIVPDIQNHFSTLCYGIEDLEGLPVIRLRDSLLYGYSRILKRSFDFVVSLLGLIIAAPAMAIIAVAVKLESPGPIFYRQDRMGLDGKVFPILKFRSMRVDAESATGPVWATAGDSRRTRLGKILRKTSFDEIPQLINVLKGEMSLVGPRPERPVFIDQFRKQIPTYMLRHKMKAGITGWAQIHGLRGNTSLEKRIEYDIYYIENWSFWLDLKILFLTIPTVLTADEAY